MSPDDLRTLCAIVGLVPLVGAIWGFIASDLHETMMRYLVLGSVWVAFYLLAMFGWLTWGPRG